MDDTIHFKTSGFDADLYRKLQKEAIIERLRTFPAGTLYLEIGGHFLSDAHASRVLPGFPIDVKPRIFRELGIPYSIIFCVNAQDIKKNRMLLDDATDYVKRVLHEIDTHKKALGVAITVAINLVSEENKTEVAAFEQILGNKGIPSFKRYVIEGYPQPARVVSKSGYGRDEYLEQSESLVLVIGPASNSGKLSTCLGQLYHDVNHGKPSGYAKFELFPIWNFTLKHPVNLAYEAATADIGDYNAIDPFHKAAYGIEAINYNRDIDAFPIITSLIQEIIPRGHALETYKSPTDMGMNKAGFAVTNDLVVADAALEEINRREQWYLAQAKAGRGELSWSKRCKELKEEAYAYIRSHK